MIVESYYKHIPMIIQSFLMRLVSSVPTFICNGTSRSCQAAQINGLPSNSTTPFPVDKRFATLIHGLSSADVSIVGYLLMHFGRIPNATAKGEALTLWLSN